MEMIFRNALKKFLTQHIKGEISVHIIDDILIVDINPLGYIPWHYSIKNIAAIPLTDTILLFSIPNFIYNGII